MSRSERWNTEREIKRKFPRLNDPKSGAGPIIYEENGQKYTDDGEAHICVVGNTGKGKSQCCSLPFLHEILQKGESLIMMDPKGEGYRLEKDKIPEDYQVFCLNFRNPRNSPDGWNPLAAPYALYQSKDLNDKDLASTMLSELWTSVYRFTGYADRFWTDSSINYALGLTYALFDLAPPKCVNLDTISKLMEETEEVIGTKEFDFLGKDFYDLLPSNSLAKRNLSNYMQAAYRTRASILSTAFNDLQIFCRSRGLLEMLSNDTLNILDIDVERPFVIFIITPDETNVYDVLAGILVSQLTQHLIQVAQDHDGKLPIRVNIILEELGSVGKSIPNLPNLMVAGRSRNIRLMLVLQGYSQLTNVYGQSRALTITSCVGITIGFSTDNWDTLEDWSRRCGLKNNEYNGFLRAEPLITSSQIAAMPTGTALVMVENQYKFITHLPFYYQMYKQPKEKLLKTKSKNKKRKVKILGYRDLIKILKDEKDEDFEDISEEDMAEALSLKFDELFGTVD